jgi:2-amino-4-hydroxy-6-hydroxymethyldihydropteridine diphosphokinase
MQVGTVLLALGGNQRGNWGAPAESMRRACRELEAAGVRIMQSSNLYLTEPVGGGRQPPYLNAVIVAAAPYAPWTLLCLVKDIERRAGRHFGAPMRARPLDIDLLSHGGRLVGWPPLRRERGRLILPHPLLHGRTFVLVPLLEVAPHWRHPAFGQRPGTLLARLSPRARTGVRRALDLSVGPCDKASALKLRFGSTVPGRVAHAALNYTRRTVAWRV